jgi:hypothetical protein
LAYFFFADAVLLIPFASKHVVFVLSFSGAGSALHECPTWNLPF